MSKNQSILWSHIKSKLSYKSKIPCILSSEGSVLTDSGQKAERFNEFFCSVFTKDNNVLPQWNIQLTDKSLTTIDFAPEVVYFKLKNLPNKTSAGPDNLPTILIKKLAIVLAEPLSILFNHSLIHSEIPSVWSLVDVLPLFKKGSDFLAQNYRPISLTCVCCRVVESIIADALMNHMSDCLFQGQHGFRSKKSTVSQLLDTLNDWTKAADKGSSVDGLYIDLAKAFDTVQHEKLLS